MSTFERARCKAVLAAIALLAGASAASASTVTIDGSYSLAFSNVIGNAPTITYRLNHTSFVEQVPLYPTEMTATQFFTTGPSSSCGSRSHPCVNNTASENITVSFNFKEAATGATGTLSVTGTFEAKYSGTALPCDPHSGTNVKTDCVYWYTGPWSATNPLDTDLVESVKLSNGDILNVILYSAHDWAITPDISFDLQHSLGTPPPRPTPLPPALALFGSGLGLIGFFSRRRAKARAHA